MAVIAPNKCIIEDQEILAFENEEHLNLYTIWHEALVDHRRELNAISDRERQIVRNDTARKTKQLISIVGSEDVRVKKITSGSRSKVSSGSSSKNSSRRTPTTAATNSPTKDTSFATSTPITSPRRTPATNTTSSALAASRRAIAAAVARVSNNSNVAQTPINYHRQGSASLPNGLTILNSSYFNTLPSGKQLMKYKLTKLYNKYRGRQVRRNFVNDKQRNARIDAEINKSYLNSWLAYTALQALRLPETNVNSLNTTTLNSSQILTPFAQTNQPYPVPLVPQNNQINANPSPKKSKSSAKKIQQQNTNSNQTTQGSQKPPMHLVYIDPGNIITYSNRINPQQVAEYRRKSHLLPSSATSKKSSAASYDVYEIMDVLANTTKTNVTITRNANRPSNNSNPNNGSIYSHSVNSNTPGIVSTQLHLQARSYLDIMSKFYAQESKRIEEEDEALKNEPTHEETLRKYLNIDHQLDTRIANGSHNSLNSNVHYSDELDQKQDALSDEDDELESLENDIRSILKTNYHQPMDIDNNQKINADPVEG